MSRDIRFTPTRRHAHCYGIRRWFTTTRNSDCRHVRALVGSTGRRWLPRPCPHVATMRRYGSLAHAKALYIA